MLGVPQSVAQIQDECRVVVVPVTTHRFLVDSRFGDPLGSGCRTWNELERFVAENPDHAEARLRLAQALLAVDPGRTRTLADAETQDVTLAELAGHLDTLAGLMLLEKNQTPERLTGPLGSAKSSLAAHRLDDALDYLVQAAGLDRQFGEQLARRAAVALFYLLGQDHESTREYRRRLASALHS